MESERKEGHNRNERHKEENQIGSRSKNNFDANNFDANNIVIITGIVLGILLIAN